MIRVRNHSGQKAMKPCLLRERSKWAVPSCTFTLPPPLNHGLGLIANKIPKYRCEVWNANRTRIISFASGGCVSWLLTSHVWVEPVGYLDHWFSRILFLSFFFPLPRYFAFHRITIAPQLLRPKSGCQHQQMHPCVLFITVRKQHG